MRPHQGAIWRECSSLGAGCTAMRPGRASDEPKLSALEPLGKAPPLRAELRLERTGPTIAANAANSGARAKTHQELHR